VGLFVAEALDLPRQDSPVISQLPRRIEPSSSPIALAVGSEVTGSAITSCWSPTRQPPTRLPAPSSRYRGEAERGAPATGLRMLGTSSPAAGSLSVKGRLHGGHRGHPATREIQQPPHRPTGRRGAPGWVMADRRGAYRRRAIVRYHEGEGNARHLDPRRPRRCGGSD
jgi:hypothetical protein